MDTRQGQPLPGAKGGIHRNAAQMQSLIGPTPVIKVERFRNWARSQIRQNVITASPCTVEETRAVILAARQVGLRVRAAGRTHSWSPLFPDEGNVVLYVGKLQRPNGSPKIEMIAHPRDSTCMYAAVAASASTGDFMQFQLENDVCIPTNVVLRVVQMGGIISTGSHGVGIDAGTIGDDIVSMRIINSCGQLVEYSMSTDPELMLAVQCSLGMFGVIVDFTIRVQPMVYVQTENYWMKVKDLFYNRDNLSRLIFGNWSVELFWFPFNAITGCEAAEAFWQKKVDMKDWDPLNDEVLIRLVNKSDKNHLPSNLQYQISDTKAWIQTKALQLVDGMVTKYPPFAPGFLKSQVSFLKTQYKGKITQRLPYAIHFRDFIEDLRLHDMEWCFSLQPDLSNLCIAIQKVVELVAKEAMAGRFPMTLPLEMRFLAHSDSFLSPLVAGNPRYGGSGHCVFIEVLTLDKTQNWEDFCQKVAYIWRPLPGAKPHWGKEWAFLHGIDDHIRNTYANQIPRFLAALQRSGADPDGTFLNARLQSLFYPKAHLPTRAICAAPAGAMAAGATAKGLVARRAPESGSAKGQPLYTWKLYI